MSAKIVDDVFSEEVFGTPSAQKFGFSSDHYSLDCAPIDLALGGKGIAAGRIYQFYGEYSAGKTTTALDLAFAFCNYWIKKGEANLKIHWVETESAFDITRAAFMRPDLLPYLDINPCETIEQAQRSIQKACDEAKISGQKLIIVWDTPGAAKTDAQAETGNKFADGQQSEARALAWFFRCLVPLFSEINATVLLPNQCYQKSDKYGNLKMVAKGGESIKFFSSCIVELKKRKKVYEELPDGSERSIGQMVEGFTEKNKVVSPHIKFNFVINNENGIDIFETIYQYLLDRKIFKLAGSWKSIAVPEKIWNKEDKGEPALKDIKWQSVNQLKSNMELMPHVFDWFNYLIYLDYASNSSLLKYQIITIIHKYERKFFGKEITKLTERELASAKALEEFLKKQQLKEEDQYKSKKKANKK